MDSSCACSLTAALKHYLESNSAIPSSAPLFAFETSNDAWAPMKRQWFLNCFNEIWTKQGLGSIKGHGFIIGSMTHLFLLGVDPWIVMVQGCWSSQSFLTYWHRCKEILPLFIGFTFQSHESILSTMSSFKNKLMSK